MGSLRHCRVKIPFVCFCSCFFPNYLASIDPSIFGVVYISYIGEDCCSTLCGNSHIVTVTVANNNPPKYSYSPKKRNRKTVSKRLLNREKGFRERLKPARESAKTTT